MALINLGQTKRRLGPHQRRHSTIRNCDGTPTKRGRSVGDGTALANACGRFVRASGRRTLQSMGTPLLKGPTNAAVRAWRRFGGGPNVCGLPYARYSARLRRSAYDAIRPIEASNAAVCCVRTTSTPALGPARAAEKLRWCTLSQTRHRVLGVSISAMCREATTISRGARCRNTLLRRGLDCANSGHPSAPRGGGRRSSREGASMIG